MTSKISIDNRELLQKISIGEAAAGIDFGNAIVRELAAFRLAAMDSEPVALQPELAKVIYHFRDWNEGFPVERFKADYVISWMLANYPPAQPAPERDQVRSAHAEWSQATFGNVGPVGPLKHLSKEALEAAAEPGYLSEWADMQFLLWDAQRRAGITDEQITQAMIEKLAVNKQREWPEPKDGEPRLHIKEQPAPVVPPMQHWEELCRQYPDMSIRDAIIRAAWWNHCRDAMLQDVSITNEGDIALHNYRTALEGIGHIRRTLEETFGGLHGTHVEPDVLIECKTICDAIYAAYSGSSPVIQDGKSVTASTGIPVIPDGYVMVPKEPTEDMRDAYYESSVAPISRLSICGYQAMLAAAPQEVK